MSTPPIPVLFEPLFKPKPWGGRRLATLLGKPLPPGERIGESWELASLPGNESRVRGGPLAGRTLAELVDAWGSGLLGSAQLADGRFPLLIKFLDASTDLSVQVHPRPQVGQAAGRAAGVKDEAWYVLHAEPDATMYVGLEAGVNLDDLAGAAGTSRVVGLLRRWPVRAGECYYLPSGAVHALGAGLVVAEVQTPADVTYRLYDWDRTGDDGRPRELHVDQALRNVRVDLPETLVVQPRRPGSCSFATSCRLVSCDSFAIDLLRLGAGPPRAIQTGRMAAWIVLGGHGQLQQKPYSCPFGRGDVVLIPAESRGMRIVAEEDCELLEVRVSSGAVGE